MSWISIILWIIQYAPEVVNIIRAILALIHPSDLGRFGAFKQAIEAGIKANDPVAVKKAVCDMHSVACAPDLVPG